jgi:cytochrome P450
MDIIADFAYPLPATIIADMIGAPSSDIALFRQWAADVNRLFELGGRIEPSSAQALQTSLQGMKEYIAGLVAERQRQPQDDILGRLVAAEEQADKLTLDELASTAVTFFVAGHETTTNLIGNGLLALLRHPDQLRELRDNPALINSAVEEMLRYDPSVPRGWRIATQDVEISGKHIHKGALLFLILSAANRDPEQFPDPDRFDIRRQPNRHLAFGYGIHFCLGAPLARLEAEIAVNTTLRRFPNIHLVDAPLAYRRDIAIRSLNALNVAL